MRSLEELKSIDDGGSFDLIVKETEKAANGDELSKLELLTDLVLRGFIDMNIRKAMKRKRLADEAFRKDALNFEIPKRRRSGSRVPVPTMVQDAVSKLESKNSSSMKRGSVGVEEEDEEIEKKQRKADHSLKKAKKKKKETTIKKTNLDDQRLRDPVNILRDFLDKIKELKGTDVMLVGQKSMTSTDMNKHHCRFSIPTGKVRTHSFLREEDNPIDGIECSMIQPCLQVIKDLEFKKWTMNKTFSYTLIKKWNSVAFNKENLLQKGSLVQLWSFRVDSNLWFALVNLDREDNVASSGNI